MEGPSSCLLHDDDDTSHKGIVKSLLIPDPFEGGARRKCVVLALRESSSKSGVIGHAYRHTTAAPAPFFGKSKLSLFEQFFPLGHQHSVREHQRQTMPKKGLVKQDTLIKP